jgi:hypothetical protein
MNFEGQYPIILFACIKKDVFFQIPHLKMGAKETGSNPNRFP